MDLPGASSGEVIPMTAPKEAKEDVIVEEVESEAEREAEEGEEKQLGEVNEKEGDEKGDEKEREKEAKTKEREDVKKRKESQEQVVIGTKVDEAHKNYVLMYVMLLGIRTTLSRCHAKPSRPCTDEDFRSANKLAFDITGHEMTPSSKYDFKFKDYAPWVFRNLRERFELDAADYLVSLTGRYVLSELGTPGKSGSFFYFSQDYRFIIKTISHTEHKFFRQILKDYFEYVMSNPNTLICRFYGLHRVKLSSGPKIHFVVMGNVNPPNRDIHESFDLKGSTHGRWVEPKKKENGKPQIFKDLNFIDFKKKIVLGPQKQKIFVEQIEKDAEFLARMNIMDYSLLLGIHDLTRGNAEQLRDRALSVFEPPKKKQVRTMTMDERKALKRAISLSGPVALDKSKAHLPENLPKERTKSPFYQDDGGFQSTDASDRPLNEIYHMGIIDILTPYNNVKKLEHFVKSANGDGEMISCVPPDKYARRFVDFLVNGTTSPKPKKERKKSRVDGDASSISGDESDRNPKD